jgi:hypothetical protein
MIPIIMSTLLWLSQKNILWTSNGNTIVWKIKIFCVMKNWKIKIFCVMKNLCKLKLFNYPSIINLWNGASLSHTGHIQVGFFSFIIRNIIASQHCKCVQELALIGILILILPSWKKSKLMSFWEDERKYKNLCNWT